ncbi:hypothetical protein D9615_009633 [Tricholomella constricta]|uniref:Uncharacterized protein n=1 Tax=Tricholomella constricta TaxID=117010 RepID=A0A8H5LW19_9AGAR|nr:hypothetical protein D9615_009633 [Tricholomella constricta]
MALLSGRPNESQPPNNPQDSEQQSLLKMHEVLEARQAGAATSGSATALAFVTARASKATVLIVKRISGYEMK